MSCIVALRCLLLILIVILFICGFNFLANMIWVELPVLLQEFPVEAPVPRDLARLPEPLIATWDIAWVRELLRVDELVISEVLSLSERLKAFIALVLVGVVQSHVPRSAERRWVTLVAAWELALIHFSEICHDGRWLSINIYWVYIYL